MVLRLCCPDEIFNAQLVSGKLKSRRSATLLHAQPRCTKHSAGLLHGHQAGAINLTGFNRLMCFDHLIKFKPGTDVMTQCPRAE